jgi:hypothetical protein
MGQFLSYSPLLAPVLVMALVRTLRRARRDDRDLFLASFSWPVLLLVVGAMVRLKDAEQHWTMVAFIPAIIAAGRYADEAWSSTKRFSLLAASGVTLSFIAFVLGVVHSRSDAIVRALPPAHYNARADMINELVGWDQVRASVGRVARTAAVEGRSVVLASNHYSMCGRLLFEMGDAPEVYCPTARRSAFDFFDRRDPPAQATVIALTNDIHTDLPIGLDGRACVLSDEVDVERAGKEVAHYFVHTCSPVSDSTSAPEARRDPNQDLEKRASRD